MNCWAAYKDGTLCLWTISITEAEVWDTLIKQIGQTNKYSDMLRYITELKSQKYTVSEVSITRRKLQEVK